MRREVHQQGGRWVKGAVLVMLALGLGVSALAPLDSRGASLPKSTEKMIAEHRLDPAVFADIDRELAVPKDWVEKARKEGKVRVASTWHDSQAKAIFAPFRERYPFIDVEYVRQSTQETRVVRTLFAYRAGKILHDVVTSLGTAFAEFEKARALENLRTLPGLQNVPEETVDPAGLSVGIEVNYWCMTYNTRLLKEQELPKTWDEVLTQPRLRGGNLGLGNRPALFAVQLWRANGEEWAKNFLTKLFNEVQPQLRKEGMNALPQLLAAGEFHAVIPSTQSQAYETAEKGGPVAYHCLNVIPATFTDVVILRGSPHTNAAKIFANWELSKEAQIASFLYSQSVPVHKDLLTPQFVPYADKILGKRIAYRTVQDHRELVPQVTEFWNKLWVGRAGR